MLSSVSIGTGSTRGGSSSVEGSGYARIGGVAVVGSSGGTGNSGLELEGRRRKSVSMDCRWCLGEVAAWCGIDGSPAGFWSPPLAV